LGSSSKLLFNQPIRPKQQRLREGDAEIFRGLEVDHQLEARGLFHGYVGRLRALEDLAHVRRGPSVQVGLHSAVRHQAAGPHEFLEAVHGRQPVLRGQLGDPPTLQKRERVGQDDERVGPLADRVGITVPLATHVPYTWRILRTLGLDRFVSDIRPIGIYGADISQRGQEIYDTTVRVMRSLIAETRAEIVLPLGGAIIPYVVDPNDLAKAVGVQVLNTKAIGIRFAELCVALRITQSALTYPRAKLTYDDFVQGGA